MIMRFEGLSEAVHVHVHVHEKTTNRVRERERVRVRKSRALVVCVPGRILKQSTVKA